jgi:hypothetical protein
MELFAVIRPGKYESCRVMPSSEGITPCKKTQVENFFLPQTDPISASSHTRCINTDKNGRTAPKNRRSHCTMK